MIYVPIIQPYSCNILFEQCDSTCNNLIQIGCVIQLQNPIYAVLQLARDTQYNFMI